MQLLLKKVRIVAPHTSFHHQIRDMLISDGHIREIAADIAPSADDKIIEAEDLHVSAGWMDVFADFCDPGLEYKEDLRSGSRAAAAGGFTTVMIVPNTQPCLQSKPQIEYIRQTTRDLPTEIIPIGALSKDIAGQSLAEMYEMHLSGAVAFSDGLQPVQSSGLLLKALQYVKAFNGVIIQVPDDRSVSHHGLMNESIQSTLLGMPGIPSLAEELLVQRDIELARYTESHIHFTGISTQKSVALIAHAKERGISVSCSVTPYHLLLTDEELHGYDSNLKVTPPLRTANDVEALRKAVADGTIDCIATHHRPQDWDSKHKEFEYTEDGMIGLESCFGVLNKALPELPLERKIALLSDNPRKIFGLPPITIAAGSKANLTLFQPAKEWTFIEQYVRSKSKNSPFFGTAMTGKPAGIIQHTHFVWNEPSL